VTREVLKRTPATRDITNHFLHIAENNLDAGLRFVDAAEAAVQCLAEMPDIGARKRFRGGSYPNVRMWAVPGFRNYLLFYTATDSTLEVLRVLHARENYRRVLGPE